MQSPAHGHDGAGRWYIPVGKNPTIDCYDCQFGDFAVGGARGAVDFTFKVPTARGGFRERSAPPHLRRD